MTTSIQKAKAKTVKQEVRLIRAAARKITASRKLSLRFLQATGMYSANGQIRAQFR